jgi:hypothetical protein
VDVCGVAKLWCSFGRDPAFGDDARAAHPAHGPDQVAVGLGKGGECFVGERGEVPFDGSVAGGFEVEQEGTCRGLEPVCVVGASVQRSPLRLAACQRDLQFAHDAEQEASIGPGQGGRAMWPQKFFGVVELCGEVGEGPSKSVRAWCTILITVAVS